MRFLNFCRKIMLRIGKVVKIENRLLDKFFFDWFSRPCSNPLSEAFVMVHNSDNFFVSTRSIHRRTLLWIYFWLKYFLKDKLGTLRTQKMTKIDEFLLKFVFCCVEGCRFEPHSWGRGFESRNETRFFFTGFRSHVSLGKNTGFRFTRIEEQNNFMFERKL